MTSTRSTLWLDRLRLAWGFVHHFGKRCIDDKVSVIAGHLTFVSLLALVPLMVVMFSVFAAFPMFEDIRLQLQEFLFANLIPTSSEIITEYLNTFVTNVSEMTTIGIIFVVIVAVNLISTIEATMNRIWRNYKRRRFTVALAVYWMILTLGPILMGIGMAVSSYLVSLTTFAENYVTGFREMLLSTVPVITSVIAFLLLYVMMPNRVVKVRYAIWGALLAGVLFEIAKKGFAAYITAFPSYEAIYGALAAIPILLLWIFVSWNIVLIGAEFTASLEEYIEKLAEKSEAATKEEKETPDEENA